MRIALILLSLLLSAPAVAEASSLAYVENGEVWLSSLDGAQKVRLAEPVVNGEGKIEKWLAVTASDGGRIVAARNVPGRMSQFSWFKVWEPNGTSTVEGPLNAPTGWTVYVYPLSFDITADGQHMVYGYSNSTGFSPIVFGRGFYVRPVTNSPLPPINVSGPEEPTLFGSRVIAHSGSTVQVQDSSTTYHTHFEDWLTTTPGGGLEVKRTDAAANGQLIALEFEQYPTVGKIVLLAAAGGVGGDLGNPPAIDCYLPASGVATDVSLSQDGRFVAWSDDQGLKVAGTPVSDAETCVMSSPPVVIAAAGKMASIGGADVSAFLPPSPPATPPATSNTTPPAANSTPSTAAAPSLTLPSKVTAKSLSSGLALKVAVGSAGKVTISGTVPAKTLGKKGKPVVVATGSATAKSAGQVTIKIKLNAAGRKKAKKLKGARLTLKITQGGRTTTKIAKLR